MKILKAVLASAILIAPLYAQTNPPWPKLATEPTNCKPGSKYYNTATAKERTCTATDTWSDASGTATSIGGVTLSGTPSAGQVPTATSGSAATWQGLGGAVTGTVGATTITNMTTVGSVPYVSSSGIFDKSANLHFDGSNLIVGVGSAVSLFNVMGDAWITGELDARGAIVAQRNSGVYFIGRKITDADYRWNVANSGVNQWGDGTGTKLGSLGPVTGGLGTVFEINGAVGGTSIGVDLNPTGGGAAKAISINSTAGVLTFYNETNSSVMFQQTAAASPNIHSATFNGSVTAVSTRTPPLAFTSLPACAAGTEGQISAVNDSSTATWGATITNGGANHVLAYCDGTNWTVVGK